LAAYIVQAAVVVVHKDWPVAHPNMDLSAAVVALRPRRRDHSPMMDSPQACHKHYWAIQLVVAALKHYSPHPYSAQNSVLLLPLAETLPRLAAALVLPMPLPLAGIRFH
jgi:hypothetical protein